MRVLLIDDDAAIRLAFAGALRSAGHLVSVAADGHEGMSKLRANSFDLVVSDVKIPGPDGFAILDYALRMKRSPDVVLMTAHGAIDAAVAALKQRATDYLAKPFQSEALVECAARIAERQGLNHAASRAPSEPIQSGHGIIGVSAGVAHVRTQIDTFGPSDAPVLLSGASGTGKELVARALHEQSRRRQEPFVAINCACFPESLLEAELFGYERGAFTGADRPRQGKFAAAGGGTLFLDEIGEMQASCQAKVLRVLQERMFSPLGTNQVLPVRARIVTATNRPLKELVRQGAFREDLYYRIKVLAIDLPPLRDREGDLSLLVEHFLFRFGGEQGPFAISSAAWLLLSEHDYPGNVRELEHAIQHAVVLASASSSREIHPEHLPADLLAAHRFRSDGDVLPVQSLASAMKAFERRFLLRALAFCHGNRTRAAKTLSISRKNLWEKLRSHGIADTEISEKMDEQPAGLGPADNTVNRE